MARGNDAVSSQSLTDVTTATWRQRLTTSTGTLTSPPSLHEEMLPTLPFDLIPEILCRLSVKLLLQLKCVCKSWKSLISDPKFAKKHLRMSTTCRHLIVASMNTSEKLLLLDSPISSIFSNLSSTSTVPQLQLMCPETIPILNVSAVSSCDGILLFSSGYGPGSDFLWNPSIRKFKILPRLLKPSFRVAIYTFGYDHFIDNYKIFVVCYSAYKSENGVPKKEVNVYTFGYDSWRRIDDIPCDCSPYEPGIFVSGTVNWLANAFSSSSFVLVSLDLEKELYRKLLTPALKKSCSTLGVLMDYLCIFINVDEFLDVWVMKEYGIIESWTKLFSVPKVGGGPSYSPAYSYVVYVSEDELVLLDCKEHSNWKLVVYNSKNGTFEIPKIQNISYWMVPEVYVESLISPCS